jgi:DNA-binding MarR family transcriptional regulator
MTVDFESGELILKLWFLLHRDYALLKGCEDQIYGENGLTTEQFSVLAAIKYVGYPVKITDIAQWMGRRTNSVSMIVDRMVKAGLVRRSRDRGDRRVVYVVVTSKGESILKPATRAGWEFIQKIMLPLSYEDRQTFARLLEMMRYETLNYLNPGEDIEEMVRNDDKSHVNLRGRLFKYALVSTPEAKRQGRKKRKTI